MRLDQGLDGHLVSGHVDAVAEVSDVAMVGDNKMLTVKMPPKLMIYVVEKGSICVDGVSLTINEITPDGVCLNLVPHTLNNSQLCFLRPGMKVNVEMDMIAKYVRKMMSAVG